MSTHTGVATYSYIAAQERSLGVLLAQENEEGKENALLPE